MNCNRVIPHAALLAFPPSSSSSSSLSSHLTHRGHDHLLGPSIDLKDVVCLEELEGLDLSKILYEEEDEAIDPHIEGHLLGIKVGKTISRDVIRVRVLGP